MIELEEEHLLPAVYGGALLGGGGGGSISTGLKLGRLALEMGRPRIAELDELNGDDLLVTVSSVGAPAAPNRYVEPVHFIQATQMLLDHMDRPVHGLISNENGAVATVNGWLQSVALGLPVVDAPCNGRAHPIGIMGAIGLDRVEGYVARSATVGGDPRAGRHVRMYVEGTTDSTARLVRQAAVAAGGSVAAARNPVTVDYARNNAAVGAWRQAVEVGKALLSAAGPEEGATAVCQLLGGEVVCRGTVERFGLRTEGGLDLGSVEISGGFELLFWNEYMTLERQGERLATFPDLIATLSAKERVPVPTAGVREGQELIVISVPQRNLILGSGMRSTQGLRAAEEAVGKPLLFGTAVQDTSQ